MINKIGVIKSINWKELKSFLIKVNSDEEFRASVNKKCFAKEDGSGYYKTFVSEDEIFNNYKYKDTLFRIDRPFFDKDKENINEYYSNKIDEKLNIIKNNLKNYQEFGIYPEIKYLDNNLVGFLYSNCEAVLMPVEFIEIEKAKDYGTLTQNQIRNLIGSSTVDIGDAVSVYGDVSYEDTKSKLSSYKEELRALEQKQKDEIEKIRLELEKKEQELRAKMSGALADLENKIEQFKDYVFVMELNIFALRTFLGDTFTIKQIKKGENLNNSPLVIYQKFRYLDEEFARFRALTDYDLDSYDSITQILEEDSDILETLAPSEKCIALFKFSKDNKDYFYSKTDDILDRERYLYGNRLGMIIRNGQNTYVSYIDEEVVLQDNLFLTKYTNEKEIEEVKNIRDSQLKNIINRKLLFLILDTLIKNSNIFNDLKDENILSSSKIIFSSVDGTITQHKYPSFRDFANKDFDDKVGDEILITQSHSGSVSRSSSWSGGRAYEEHRSRSYDNRARDADIEKGISFINIIDIDSIGFYKYYEENGSKYRELIYGKAIEKAKEEGFEVKEEFKTRYYVSCERPDYVQDYDWLGRPKRINNVNLEIYLDEFINITYLNSNIVKSWIDGKNIGYIGGMNYVYLVGQFKDLLKHLLNREEQELIQIRKFYRMWENTSDNLDLLLSWKEEKKVRKLTEYQAKRFVKYLEGLKK